MIELKDHQKPPVKYIKNNKGLILYHGLGSGKTITSLVSMYQFNKDIIIIGTKSSKKIFNDEIEKLGYDKKRFTLITFQKIKMETQNKLEFFNNKCVIVDEAHHLRNETRDVLLLQSALDMSYKIILLTATPVVNYPNDIAILVNIVKGHDVLPTSRDEFNFLYFDEDSFRLQNEKTLEDRIKGTISFFEKKDDKDYPKKTVHYEKVQMNVQQMDEYKKYVIKLIFEGEHPGTINVFNVQFEDLDKKKKNFFLSATRQISNNVKNDEITPKIQAIFDKIKNGPFPVIVYSNFLSNGVYPVSSLLSKERLSYKTITGSTGSDKINMIVNDYNKGKYQVLLLSSAGSESLDLKNTRQIHIMEPHWNEAKIDQVIGRAVRYKSHSQLPEKDRHVDIYRWISIFRSPYTNQSADEYLMEISKRKRNMFDRFKGLIIRASIENNKENKNGGCFKRYTELKKEYISLKYK